MSESDEKNARRFQNVKIKTLERDRSIETNFEKENDLDPMLDPNHSHFILVDDGSEGQYGKEIQFRNELEVELCRGRNIGYYKEKTKSKIRGESRYTKGISYISTSEINYDETADEKIPMVII